MIVIIVTLCIYMYMYFSINMHSSIIISTFFQFFGLSRLITEYRKNATENRIELYNLINRIENILIIRYDFRLTKYT